MSKTKSRLAKERAAAVNRATLRTMFPNRELVAHDWNMHVPKVARGAVFPHWKSESAVTLRQIVSWADDDIDWILTRARCDRDVFFRIAYGVISDTDVSVEWWNETAVQINEAVRDLQRQRVAEAERLKNVATYWTDMQGGDGADADVPENVVLLSSRSHRGEP